MAMGSAGVELPLLLGELSELAAALAAAAAAMAALVSGPDSVAAGVVVTERLSFGPFEFLREALSSAILQTHNNTHKKKGQCVKCE
jgi:hypothetical protein